MGIVPVAVGKVAEAPKESLAFPVLNFFVLTPRQLSKTVLSGLRDGVVIQRASVGTFLGL